MAALLSRRTDLGSSAEAVNNGSASEGEDKQNTKSRNRSRKGKNGQKKQPQRGLGVAQLEKLRLQEQKRQQQEAICLASLHGIHGLPSVSNMSFLDQVVSYQPQLPVRTGNGLHVSSIDQRSGPVYNVVRPRCFDRGSPDFHRHFGFNHLNTAHSGSGFSSSIRLRESHCPSDGFVFQKQMNMNADSFPANSVSSSRASSSGPTSPADDSRSGFPLHEKDDSAHMNSGRKPPSSLPFEKFVGSADGKNGQKQYDFPPVMLAFKDADMHGLKFHILSKDSGELDSSRPPDFLNIQRDNKELPTKVVIPSFGNRPKELSSFQSYTSNQAWASEENTFEKKRPRFALESSSNGPIQTKFIKSNDYGSDDTGATRMPGSPINYTSSALPMFWKSGSEITLVKDAAKSDKGSVNVLPFMKEQFGHANFLLPRSYSKINAAASTCEVLSEAEIESRPMSDFLSLGLSNSNLTSVQRTDQSSNKGLDALDSVITVEVDKNLNPLGKDPEKNGGSSCLSSSRHPQQLSSLSHGACLVSDGTPPKVKAYNVGKLELHFEERSLDLSLKLAL